MIYLERISQKRRESEFVRTLDGTIVDHGRIYTDLNFTCSCGVHHHVDYCGQAPDSLRCSVCGFYSTWEEMMKNLHRIPARGIGVEGVASEIGALGREALAVERERLVRGLCYRFTASIEEAESAIKQAEDVGVITEVRGQIVLIRGSAE